MVKIGGHEIDISSRDKVYFPDAGLTKGDVIDYYEQVAGTMVAHMKRYPVTMQRFPDGLEGEGFFNKDTPDHFPDWIERVNFPRRDDGSFEAPIVDSKAALIYLANQAVLTPHLYLARADDLEHPDKMIYDLDPPEDSQDFGAVREAALDLRGVLHEVDLEAWVQTTGSKGFHVVIPLDRSAGFDQVREFARRVARLLVRRHEDKYTLEQRKDKRAGRIYLDVQRNSYGGTAVSPYAVRAKPGAPVATPVTWQEVEAGASPRDWTIENVPARLAQKRDPWSDLAQHGRSLERRRDDLEQLLEKEEPAEEED